MTDSSRRRPYWLLPIFVALILLPQPWALAALIAAAGGAIAVRAARRAAARVSGGADEAGAGGGVQLGADHTGRPVVLTDRQLSAHALILGASGAGKSTTLLNVLTDHIRRGRPVIAIDMKGAPDFAARLADAAAAAGRPFRVWTPDGPGSWNPLQHGNPTELKDKLISTERFTEPHYRRAAERYIQSVMQVLARAHHGRAPTLSEVVRLMDPPQLRAALRAVPADLAERVNDYIASLTPDQLSAVRGLGTRLAIISESETGRFLEPGGAAGGAIDLRAALAGDEVVLFSLNSASYSGLSAQLGALAIQDLVAAVGHRLTFEPLGAQALIGIDEFSALGGDHILSLLARGRGSGVSVLLATQELADLDRAAHGLRDQVLGNTAVKIIHRQDVPRSAQTVAEMAGTRTVWEETQQLGHHPLFGSHRTGRGTRREVERFIVHPNDIKALPTGHAVLITKLPRALTRTVRVSPPQAPRRDGPELG
jgi:type IV secretory pathway TraG/TraD family ATPase VirD4